MSYKKIYDLQARVRSSDRVLSSFDEDDDGITLLRGRKLTIIAGKLGLTHTPFTRQDINNHSRETGANTYTFYEAGY